MAVPLKREELEKKKRKSGRERLTVLESQEYFILSSFSSPNAILTYDAHSLAILHTVPCSFSSLSYCSLSLSLSFFLAILHLSSPSHLASCNLYSLPAPSASTAATATACLSQSRLTQTIISLLSMIWAVANNSLRRGGKREREK